MKRILISIILLISVLIVVGQNDSIPIDSIKLVKYTPDFKFIEGIYLNIEQFKNNTPIPKSFVVSQKGNSDLDFFSSILEEEEISFFDSNGMKESYKTKNIWGYCNQGVVFIQYNDEFNRIPVVGSISHFVSNYTSTQYRRNDPYNTYGNPYYTDPLMRNQSITTKELKQYLLDFETGNIMDYSYDNLMIILMRDVELYEEFNNLKRRQKKKMVFFYLRKYNERNPLYIPVKVD